MSGSIAGIDPVFSVDDGQIGGLAPNFRFVLWSLAKWNETNDRRWSNPDCVLLATGAFVLEVPLTPDRWSDVFGHKCDESGQTRSAFDALLKSIAQIGFTCGGGISFGHGVGLVSGAAKFLCNEFALP